MVPHNGPDNKSEREPRKRTNDERPSFDFPSPMIRRWPPWLRILTIISATVLLWAIIFASI